MSEDMEFEDWPVRDDDPEEVALEARQDRLRAIVSSSFGRTAKTLGDFRRALIEEEFSEHGAEAIVRIYYDELLDITMAEDREDRDLDEDDS